MHTSVIDALDHAIYVHTNWKHRLKLMIRKGAIDGDEALLKDPARCELGRWLGTQSPASLPDYDKILAEHRLFHRQVADIVTLIKENKLDEAEQAISGTSPFNLTSARLVNLLGDSQAALHK